VRQGHAALTVDSDYARALGRLYALGPGRMLQGRERLARLLAVAGNPECAVPAVLIGGTNGKGRLVTALSAILARRYRVGAFIKPHLKSIRERWRINDRDVSPGAFTSACDEALDLIEQCGEPISFFEANALIAALLFRDSGCKIALWEVGLGGHHDACNLTEPFLSVLTGVGLDHQAILGDSVERIAADKAHIARQGRPLLLGPPRPGQEAIFTRYSPVVEQVCREIGARFQSVPLTPTAWDGWTAARDGLPPDSLALLHAALPHLAAEGFMVPPEDVRAGVDAVRYRARMEWTQLRGAPVILDAAHNVDALAWLARELGGTTHPVVFGCQATREPEELLAALKPAIRVLVPIEVPVMHPCPVSRIAVAASALGIPVSLPSGVTLSDAPTDYPIGHITELDPPDNRTGWIECVEHALSLASAEAPTVICGSIYCVGEVLRAFEGMDES